MMATLHPAVALRTLLLALLCLDHTCSKTINTFAGPYIAFAHQFDTCPSDGTMVVAIRSTHFNPLKPYERQMISGNMTSQVDVGDNLWSSADLATWSNNQWKENAFIFNFPRVGCSALREHIPDFFRIVSKYSGVPMDTKEPCLIPKGSYVIANESVSWVFPHFPVMPYGRYRFRVRTKNAANSNIFRFCVQVDCEVIPKP